MTESARLSIPVVDGLDVTVAGEPRHLIAIGDLGAIAAWFDSCVLRLRLRAIQLETSPDAPESCGNCGAPFWFLTWDPADGWGCAYCHANDSIAAGDAPKVRYAEPRDRHAG